VFANVNPKTQTPVINTLLVGAVAAGFAGFKGLDFLGEHHQRRHARRLRI
jgi:hypothetical protein